MKKVTKKEFYDFFNDRLNITTGVNIGNTNEWDVKQNGLLIAKAVERISLNPGEDYSITDYFINN